MLPHRYGSKSPEQSENDPPNPELGVQERPSLDKDAADDDDVRRHEAVAFLQGLLEQWVNDDNDPTSTSAAVTVVPFGSWRIGVHQRNSDLDLLVLCTNKTRADFFGSFQERLLQCARISNVHAIPSAYTPVCKLVLDEILHVDLLFVQLAQPEKLLAYCQAQTQGQGQPLFENGHAYYHLDDTDLIHQDEAGVRSLNGARVSQWLLEKVPNMANYRTCLNTMKTWAQAQGVYSSVLGFWGGIHWSLLVAFVCRQCDVDTPPNALLERGVDMFVAWPWPRPVVLDETATVVPPGIAPLPVWDASTNPRDARHACPILTPVYPCMNSSTLVGRAQLRRLQEELGQLQRQHATKTIFGTFWTQHVHFLQVVVYGSQNTEWFRFVERSLRTLITSLEESPQVQAWPYARFFHEQHDDSKVDTRESHFFIGLRFAPGVDTVPLRYFVSSFLHMVNTWEHRQVGMDLSLNHVTADKLPTLVTEQETTVNAMAMTDAAIVENETAIDENESPAKKCRVELAEVEPMGQHA